MSKTARLGLTLVELMITVALIIAVAALSVPVYQSFQVKNDLDVAAITLAQSLRRAQIRAAASEGDASWGVKVESGSIVLFKGVSYASRDADYDETFTVPATITQSGATEFVFSKFTGAVDTAGTTTLTSVANETRNVGVNAKGAVTY